MAPPDRDVRVLPERPAAHVDRLVRAAGAALVSLADGACDAGDGAWHCADAVPAAAADLFFYRDAVGNWRNSHGELCVPELLGPRARRAAPRRSIPGETRTPDLVSEVSRDSRHARRR